jgi:hypothetical protein
MYKTDGTVSGTSQLFHVNSSWSGLLGVFSGDNLIFRGNLENGLGIELLQYNVNSQVLSSITDINPGYSGSYPDNFALLNNTVVFTANDGTSTKVWSYLVEDQSSPPPPPPAPSNNKSSASLADPIQRSTIASTTPVASVSETGTIITIAGTFVEKITNIQISITGFTNYSSFLPSQSWIQTPTSLTLILPKGIQGNYSIQIFNGSKPPLPLLMASVFATPEVKPVTPQPILPTKPEPSAPTKSITKTPAKIISIKCVKGKVVKTVKGTKPKCPSGYVKR